MDEQIQDAIPCIDPQAVAHQEKVRKLMADIMELLKGCTYAEADNILGNCKWEIKTNSIIQ